MITRKQWKFLKMLRTQCWVVGKDLPLAKGFHLQVREAYPDESNTTIREALGFHCQHAKYLRNQKTGSIRYTLSGQPDGKVSSAQAKSVHKALIKRATAKSYDRRQSGKYGRPVLGVKR